MYVGVTSHKNSLGMIALVSVLTLAWALLERWRSGLWRTDKTGAFAESLGLVISVYVLQLSHSATSIVCTVLGLCILLGTSLPSVKKNIKQTGIWVMIGCMVIFALNETFDIKDEFLELLGRDPTLTTRTEVWPVLLSYQQSPVLGPGFKSFWAGERLKEMLSEYGIIQAHNGYLETYLNGGFVGTGLLVLFLLSGGSRILKSLLLGREAAGVRLMFWVVAVIHNFTEASFNTFEPLWLALLFVSIDYKPEHEAMHLSDAEEWSSLGSLQKDSGT